MDITNNTAASPLSSTAGQPVAIDADGHIHLSDITTMIDYFDIRFIAHGVDFIGKPLSTVQPSGAVSRSFTEHKVGYPDKRAPSITMKYSARSQELRVWGCPLRFLQDHNGMGSNDLPFLVAECVALAFAHLQRGMPISIRQQLLDRSYKVVEAHVAELHRMPHGLIAAFCDAIRRHGPASLQARPLDQGIGVRLWPESRERQILIYDKVHYFWDSMTKHRLTLLGRRPFRSWERLGPAVTFDRMMDEHLNQGIRIETRHQRNLKTHGLNVGSAWTSNSARQIHHRVLDDVPLADLPPIGEAEALLAAARQEERRLIALWLDGRRIASFFDAPATYDRWRRRILAQHGVNLSQAPIPCEQARWSSLIAPDSVLETPAWALEGPLLHDPAHVEQGLMVPPSRDAWPPLAKTKTSKHVPTANVVPARAQRRR